MTERHQREAIPDTETTMPDSLNTLCLGASYGSLLATKLALAGHHSTLVCLPAEAGRINAEGVVLRLPVAGQPDLVEIRTPGLAGRIQASGPESVNPAGFDLCVLAMQEPQFRQPEVRALVHRIRDAALPCMSIMNMPPLPYLQRIPDIDIECCRPAFTDDTVWEGFDPALMTLCSPDAQAFRPPDEPVNVLQVRLPTNFKATRFKAGSHTEMLRRLEADIDAVRWRVGDRTVPLPVKLRVHDSLFVPMAKWCMLLAGNYRCILADSVRSIRDAVHADLQESRKVYESVVRLCLSLGADMSDMVSFDKYAAAAEFLASPSSAARAVAAGAPNIERVDRLVQSLAASAGERLADVDRIVEIVDQRLRRNRTAGQA